MAGLLRRKMRDTVAFHTATKDQYGTATAVLVGVVPALLRIGATRTFGGNAEQDSSDAQMWLDPANATVAGLGGEIQGCIVKAQKENYPTPDSESWYVITGIRVAEDRLLKNRVAFIRCSLQKIEQPVVAGA